MRAPVRGSIRYMAMSLLVDSDGCVAYVVTEAVTHTQGGVEQERVTTHLDEQGGGGEVQEVLVLDLACSAAEYADELCIDFPPQGSARRALQPYPNPARACFS